MKKPDRFERQVLQAIKRAGVRCGPDDITISLTGPEVVKLLRREHAWMRRMVITVSNGKLNSSLIMKMPVWSSSISSPSGGRDNEP